MSSLYPLRFEPLFRRYLWGGRRLGSVFGKAIGPEADYAESWELVDRTGDQSVVRHGALAGTTLSELVQSRGDELLGVHHPQPRFPLLVKLLDANSQLSVQVHPNDAQGALLTPPDLGKTEAWVVLAAEPGSYLYAGLKPGVDRADLAREVAAGTCEDLLHRVEPNVGDCFYLRAGTVHALGPGLLIAEIQQSSDTTYRLYDWNRKGADGKTRQLHVGEALDVTDFAAGPLHAANPQATDRPHVERLVNGDKFVIDRWRIESPQTVGGDKRCHIVMVLAGSVTIAGDPADKPLVAGETVLLPATLGPTNITPAAGTILLDAYLPCAI